MKFTKKAIYLIIYFIISITIMYSVGYYNGHKVNNYHELTMCFDGCFFAEKYQFGWDLIDSTDMYDECSQMCWQEKIDGIRIKRE